MRALLPLLLAAPLAVSAAESLRITRPLQYTGMCDASGAVAVSSNLFVVASDEDNILRLYRTDQPGKPIKQFDCNAFLEVGPKSPEADLEAAAMIGHRAFWIGSHGRNKEGKERLNRQRFFATDIGVINGEVTLTPVGKPCKRLLQDLLADSSFAQFHFEQAARLAPKQPDALNIEGLSATAEGHLLIGFRNPIPAGKALLIPLLNPNDVIQGKPAQFGAPIQLDLGGLGMRDIAWHAGTYLIIAGPWHGGNPFRLYRWRGPGTQPERVRVKHLDDYHPEAVILYAKLGLQQFQILSDDGTRLMDGCPCKDLPDPNRRTFRSFWVGP